MLSRTLATIGLLSILATPAFAVNFIQTEVALGTIIVNLVNGNITACPQLTLATGGPPLGTCVKIGTINVTGVNGVATNMAISSTGGIVAAVITNLINGDVMLCSTLLNSAGAVIGTCKAGQTF